MPEAKNTFIKSRMNKDLDARLIPNGEYREAFNVTISKSEGEGVGSLENILGNIYKTNFGFATTGELPQPMECIGHFADEANVRIILFLTAYEDSSADNLSNNINDVQFPPGLQQPYSAIVCFNLNSGTYNVLTQGNYLNFSTTHPIIGVNLIEDLLFFTDNRNQPRKINVETAINNPTYYSNEDHISVAKYYPYSPICLLENVDSNNLVQGTNVPAYNSGMKDVVSEYLPIHTCGRITAVSGNTITIAGVHRNLQPEQATNLKDGDLITSDRINSKVTIDSLTINASTTDFTFNSESALTAAQLFAVNDIVYFQRQNPLYNVNWPGDQQYAKRKFLRFSYRYKFDDGEYSLMAPFTQIAFVPEQDGYFIGDKAVMRVVTQAGDVESEGSMQVGQESRAYETTIVEFMENKINDYNLLISAPSKLTNSGELMKFNEINSLLKITEIDILLKVSDSQNVTVVDTLKIEDFGNITEDYYNYNYQSKKPWRILPENEITRVSDAVPVRAFSQEVAGNRVIYGNFFDKHSSPLNLDYTIAVAEKAPLPAWDGQTSKPDGWDNKDNYVRKEYQNHTVKQNRTYQVGVVLSDRYGRQSNVILSKLKSNTNATEKGDTIYHRYRSVEQNLITDNSGNYPVNPGDTWPGDIFQATFFSPIPSQKDNGYPGTFSVADGAILTVNFAIAEISAIAPGAYTSTSVTQTGNSQASGAQISFDIVQLQGGVLIIDPTSIVLDKAGSGYIQGPINVNIPNNPSSIDATITTGVQNILGWYSYKFVIKQQEQEYYNVYLPGALAGYPENQTGTTGTVEFTYPLGREKSTSHIVLINDNINKIPRDLTEVGPDQLKFRSSERVYPRVKNILIGNDNYSSTQVDPETRFDTVVAIGTMQDLELGDTKLNFDSKTIPSMFYSGESNPLIARVEVNNMFGVPQSIMDDAFSTTANDPDQGPTLAVYETVPVESNLELFYESTTSGLINQLNNDIENTDNTIPLGLSIGEISWSEGDPQGTDITGDFRGTGPGGVFLDGVATIELLSVKTAAGSDVTDRFSFNNVSSGVYNITLSNYTSSFPGFIFVENSLQNIYQFRFRVVRTIDGVSINVLVHGELFNRAPNEVLLNDPPELTKDQIHEAAYKAPGAAGSAVFTSRFGDPFVKFSTGTSYTYNGGTINFGEIGMFKSNDSISSFGFGVINGGTSNYGLVPSNYGDNSGYTPIVKVEFDLNQNEPWPSNPSAGETMLFNATNGMFGSEASNPPFNPVEVNPAGAIGTLPVNTQVVWSLPRMYQVSSFRYDYEVNPTGKLLELVFGSQFANGFNAPPGPIYWANDDTQLNTTLGGESSVGQRYNNNKHYWADLEAMKANDPAIMTLQNGYNSFYDLSLLDTRSDGSPITPNAGNLLYYIGGIDANGLGPVDGDMKFFVYETNPPATIGPSQAYLRAGAQNPIYNQFTGILSSANYFYSQGNSSEQNGLGLPGGRYVVTIRATDANGTGDIFEWDMPIVLSPWNLTPNDPSRLPPTS